MADRRVALTMNCDMNNIDFDQLYQEFELAKTKVGSLRSLETFKRQWLGKEGIVKDLFKQLKDYSAEEKPQIAAQLNKFKDQIEDFVSSISDQFTAQRRSDQIKQEFFDLSLPAKSAGWGSIHPVRVVERRIDALLRPFGVTIVEGPEIETEYYCFDALNIPKHHPARDMQDTFYTDNGLLLRTHTTSVQARELEKKELPLKIVSCGRVYRNETEDVSHQAMFRQYELVWIEKGLTLSHLMGILSYVLKGLYGKRRKVRFVPKYYPYTEPSLGAQIDCGICKGTGCTSCDGAGWVTLAGSGMVHQKVLEEFAYDHKAVSGIAFGFGTDRLAAQFFGAPNLRALYSNDLRAYEGIA